MLWDVLSYRNVIVLHHGEWKLYSVLTSVSNSHFLQYSQRWRNDEISLGVCYKTIKLFLREKNNSVIVKSRILYSNKTYFWAPDIPCNYDLFTILRSSHRMCFIKKCILENFPNFIGKHLCKGLFLTKLEGWGLFWQDTSRNCFGIFLNIHIKNNFRSSCPEMFCKKGVLRNFTKFTGNPCGSGLQLY